jgi:hypothetical protein
MKRYVAIVSPRTDNAIKIPYVKVNGKIIPFDRKVEINENDLKALQGMKEPKKKGLAIDVHQIMDNLKINQEKANRIARLQEREGMYGKGNVQFIPKYTVNIVKELKG